jgi:hypothetical protein
VSVIGQIRPKPANVKNMKNVGAGSMTETWDDDIFRSWLANPPSFFQSGDVAIAKMPFVFLGFKTYM